MKILILGANGMIGHRILIEAREQFGNHVFGLIKRNKNEFMFCAFLQEDIYDQIDVSNWTNLNNLLNILKPDVIVNAVGVTIRREEIKNLDYALEINSFLPQRLAKWAQLNQAKIIHLSTDCVFAGESGSYTEQSIPTAKDIYGRTKFLGEVLGDNCLTLRFSCIGRELINRTELLEWFLAQNGNKIKGYTQALYSGVTTLVIAKEVCRVIRDFKTLTGIFQISSRPISKYDLLILANKYFKTNIEIEPFDSYVSDKTLINDKFVKKTGYKVLDWEIMMEELATDTRVAYTR